MSLPAFEILWERAVDRHGEDALRAAFPRVASADVLRALPDDRVLSAMARRVFAAGFRMKVIEAKWEGFEEAFRRFDVDSVADLDGDGIEALAGDARIVRNRPKIVSTVHNADFVRAVREEHGSFGRWLADWPADDTVGLWAELKARGDRLGGDTGAWFLRSVGKDTFRLSADVIGALVAAGVVDKPPTSKKALASVQRAFDTWTAESGLSQGAVSVVLARGSGPIYGA